MSFKRGMVEQSVVYPYHGILLSHKSIIDYWYTQQLGVSQRYNAEYKETILKVTYYMTYMDMLLSKWQSIEVDKISLVVAKN